MPLQWEEPPKGLHLNCVPRCAFLYLFWAQRCVRRTVRSLRAALTPRGLPVAGERGLRERGCASFRRGETLGEGTAETRRGDAQRRERTGCAAGEAQRLEKRRGDARRGAVGPARPGRKLCPILRGGRGRAPLPMSLRSTSLLQSCLRVARRVKSGVSL